MSEEASLEKVRIHLLNSRGLDISGYSRSFTLRSLRKRMGKVSIETIETYANTLCASEDETSAFIDALSINVTDFFRDEGAFESLSSKAIRPMLKSKKEHAGIVRIWSAGCSTGQETYTLAICLEEELKKQGMLDEVLASVTGTDLSSAALAKAKLGIYPEEKVRGVPHRLLREYFVRRNGTYEVAEKIKRRVRFSIENLMDPPKTRFFDAVVCRNVLIYFSRPSHDKVVMNLHEALRVGGYLMLGKTEALMGDPRSKFELIEAENRIFRKLA